MHVRILADHDIDHLGSGCAREIENAVPAAVASATVSSYSPARRFNIQRRLRIYMGVYEIVPPIRHRRGETDRAINAGCHNLPRIQMR